MTRKRKVELSRAKRTQITKLTDAAVAAMDAGEFARGRDAAIEAWEMLPEPREGWSTSFLLSVIAFEAEMALGNYGAARAVVGQAAECATADEASVCVMRGRAKFELGDKKGAAAEFLFGLLRGGPAEFEDLDPKYYAFACKRLKPPAGCKTWDDYEPDEAEVSDE